jgi:hypothetical protein
LNLRDSFPELREKNDAAEWSDVECFARALYSKLSPAARLLPKRALERYNEIQQLADYVFKKVKVAENERAAKTERAIIRAIIEYEYSAGKKDPSWSFTEQNVDRIVEDFRLIKDFYVGAHVDSMWPIAKSFGHFFLNEDDTATLKKNEFASQDARDEWLVNKAIPPLQPLWYFIVSMCRLLQEKENPLTAEDAYWLGIVNEVVGSGLPCIRQIYEYEEPQSPTAPADAPPSASPLPA